MARFCSYCAQVSDENQRIDAVLANQGIYPSRSAAAHAIERGDVLVCGVRVQKKYKVIAGDTIVYEVHEEPTVQGIYGEPIDLDIRYEDNDMLVLSKQAGLVCHPSIDHKTGTLVQALVYHCGVDNLCNVQGEDDRLGIVHRLDGNTSGLMLAAKSNEAGVRLMDAIRMRSIDRHYLTLVHGIMAHDTGMIDAPIARSAQERTRMAVRDVASAREAITTFRVLERFDAERHDDGYTLIECKLFTGRTHQIRVHMQYTRHPVVGDYMYDAHSPRFESANLGLDRQFLHSYSLVLDHPITGEHLAFDDNLPAELSDVLHKLASRSRGKTEAGYEVAQRLMHAPHPSAQRIIYE